MTAADGFDSIRGTVKAIDIRNVPAEIQAAVDAAARDRDMSRNDLIVAVLCERYGLQCDQSGSKYQGGSSSQWLVRVPDGLHEMVRANAKQAHGTLPGVVLMVLAQAFGLEAFSPRKRMQRALTDEQVLEVKRRVGAREISQHALAKELGVTRKVIAAAVHS